MKCFAFFFFSFTLAVSRYFFVFVIFILCYLFNKRKKESFFSYVRLMILLCFAVAMIVLSVRNTNQTAGPSARGCSPSYIPLNRHKVSAQIFDANANRKIEPHVPPVTIGFGDAWQEHRPVAIDDDEESGARIGRRMDDGPINLLTDDQFFALPNVRRRRRHHDDEQARLLSQSAFSRISETLGALNTVGSFLVNITRGANGDHRGDMQLISSSALGGNKPQTSVNNQLFFEPVETTTAQSVPDALLTLTKNVLGHNMTKTIEPLIKRVHTPTVTHKEPVTSASSARTTTTASATKTTSLPRKDAHIDIQLLSEKIDMAALEEKKRKKHQAIHTKIASPTKPVATSTVAPGANYALA